MDNLNAVEGEEDEGFFMCLNEANASGIPLGSNSEKRTVMLLGNTLPATQS